MLYEATECRIIVDRSAEAGRGGAPATPDSAEAAAVLADAGACGVASLRRGIDTTAA